MNKKLKVSFLFLFLPIMTYVISVSVGLDPSEPLDGYPSESIVVESVKYEKVEQARGLFRTNTFYNLVVYPKGSDSLFIYRSPHRENVERYRLRISSGDSGLLHYLDKVEDGRRRIISFVREDGTEIIPHSEIVQESESRNRLLTVMSVIWVFLGLVFLVLGLREQKALNNRGSFEAQHVWSRCSCVVPLSGTRYALINCCTEEPATTAKPTPRR